ncbi:MAG: hypothetical protein MZW92_04995 [Comamonadaceae bacterium]|nr:hypothetical protein [Comamonadaceae bacterium]
MIAGARPRIASPAAARIAGALTTWFVGSTGARWSRLALGRSSTLVPVVARAARRADCSASASAWRCWPAALRRA